MMGDAAPDGNVGGDLLQQIFVAEMTTARVVCAHCGQERLYMTQPGSVLRSRTRLSVEKPRREARANRAVAKVPEEGFTCWALMRTKDVEAGEGGRPVNRPGSSASPSPAPPTVVSDFAPSP